MKNQILALAIVLGSITGIFANNNPANSTLTLSPDETSFIVDVSAFEGEALYLSVTDKYGNSIFTDSFKSNKTKIQYVLDKLQEGTYTVKIKGDKTVEYYVINLHDTSISLVEKEVHSSPMIVKEANKIIVQSTNANQNDLRFFVFNSKGETIYKNTGFSQKAFNLKELDNGTYRVVVSDDEFSNELYVSL